jgi:hypothetical protein
LCCFVLEFVGRANVTSVVVLEHAQRAVVAERPPGVGLVLADRARFASLLAGFGLELTSDAIGTRTDVDKPPRGALDAFFSQEWEYC